MTFPLLFPFFSPSFSFSFDVFVSHPRREQTKQFFLFFFFVLLYVVSLRHKTKHICCDLVNAGQLGLFRLQTKTPKIKTLSAVEPMRLDVDLDGEGGIEMSDWKGWTAWTAGIQLAQ